MKIRVSYLDDDELYEVLQLLRPVIIRVRKQPAKGRFKRAYIDTKTPISADNSGENADIG